MKNIRTMMVVLLSFFSLLGSWAQEGKMMFSEEESVRYVKPVIPGQEIGFAPASVQVSLSNLVNMPEKIEIMSVCSLSSTNVAASRRNVMASMIGLEGATNQLDPAGYHVIPTNGWQWHHMLVSTTLPLYRGLTNDLPEPLSSERGNRIVLPLVLRFPVSAYECRVASSVSNIQDRTFWVGRDSVTGSNIMFNANFIGVHPGPDGMVESTYDMATGLVTQRGDDTIYTNGEDPEHVPYVFVVRFGASVSIIVNSEAGLNMIKGQFAQSNQMFTAQLIKDGTVVDQKTVSAQQPRIFIEKGEPIAGQPTVNLWVRGQDDVNYRLESHFVWDEEWLGFDDDTPYLWSNWRMIQGIQLPQVDGNEFLRVVSISP